MTPIVRKIGITKNMKITIDLPIPGSWITLIKLTSINIPIIIKGISMARSGPPSSNPPLAPIMISGTPIKVIKPIWMNRLPTTHFKLVRFSALVIFNPIFRNNISEAMNIIGTTIKIISSGVRPIWNIEYSNNIPNSCITIL